MQVKNMRIWVEVCERTGVYMCEEDRSECIETSKGVGRNNSRKLKRKVTNPCAVLVHLRW